MKWITEGFDDFSKGQMENGGQNLFVSKRGVLQRIFQFDINLDGYPDLMFAGGQSMYEKPPVHVYRNALADPTFYELPTNGVYDAILTDLFGNGYDDLVVACQHNGSTFNVTSLIYFGSEEGLSENYKMELPVPNSIGVAAGDFNGSGKKDLAFISNDTLRVFYHQASGFNSSKYTDYPLQISAIAAADLDGDGYCDLLFKTFDGKAGVLFGSPDGLDEKKLAWLDIHKEAQLAASGGSTAGVANACSSWRPCVVELDGITYFFCAEGEHACFYRCTEDRRLTCAFKLPCPGAIHAVASDLTGNGFRDLVLTVFSDEEQGAPCRIYFNNGNGLHTDLFTPVFVKGAASATIADLDGPVLLFSRLGDGDNLDVEAPVYRINRQRTPVLVGSIPCSDCMKILAGHPSSQKNTDTLVVINHKMNRLYGEEKSMIYLGGPDGYQADQKIEFQGHSSTEGIMCDLFDSGYPDVFLTNSFEDHVPADDGCYIYKNTGGVLSEAPVIKLPSVRAHGAAIGDFRHSGFLDIAITGFYNQEMRIYHGSESGYSPDNFTRLVFGPHEEGYAPKVTRDFDSILGSESEESVRNILEYGEIRWLLAADYNNDGWLDLFVSEINGSRCFILWGGPNGFSTDRMTALETDGVASATAVDLNGNGYLDLILAQFQSLNKQEANEAYITIYWGSAEGYRENRKLQLPVQGSTWVTVGDYNGNGLFDLFATSYTNGFTRDLPSTLYENHNGTFSVNHRKFFMGHSCCGCQSGDFNGDGYTDLAVCCHKTYGNHKSESYIYWGGPDGISEANKSLLPTCGPHGMTKVDPGNIMNRSNKEHYTSVAKELPANTVVHSISWDGICTSTSWVEIEIRASENAEQLSDAAWIRVNAGEDISHLGLHGLVQYRLALCAKCGCGTPRVTKVTVDCCNI